MGCDAPMKSLSRAPLTRGDTGSFDISWPWSCGTVRRVGYCDLLTLQTRHGRAPSSVTPDLYCPPSMKWRYCIQQKVARYDAVSVHLPSVPLGCFATRSTPFTATIPDYKPFTGTVDGHGCLNWAVKTLSRSRKWHSTVSFQLPKVLRSYSKIRACVDWIGSKDPRYPSVEVIARPFLHTLDLCIHQPYC